MDLVSFLEQKPLFYDVIDYERMPRVYARIAHDFTLPQIIHVVGTNGKGSTGRFLAQMLLSCGHRVGHYTSPHILCFNERIWIDGEDADDALLQKNHLALHALLTSEEASALSYFEYTTLLAMLIFSKRCDYVVLEAGLGGEYDATNVFPKRLSIITPIGYDHQAFLGESIEAIATTKLNSITNDCILAQQDEACVYPLALLRTQALKKQLIVADTYLSDAKKNEIKNYCLRKNYPSFLEDNCITAYSALTFLGYDIDMDLMDGPFLKGRYQQFFPNVHLDVGHNPLAAHALVKAVGKKKVILVYNSYADKEYAEIFGILKPIIASIEVIDIQSSRAVQSECLYKVADTLGLSITAFQSLKDDKEYLVFGSFSVVEAFLKGYRER